MLTTTAFVTGIFCGRAAKDRSCFIASSTAAIAFWTPTNSAVAFFLRSWTASTLRLLTSKSSPSTSVFTWSLSSDVSGYSDFHK